MGQPKISPILYITKYTITDDGSDPMLNPEINVNMEDNII